MNRDVCEHFNPVDLPCDKCKREAMTQPTALFLADILEDAGKPADIAEKCASELRRLHFKCNSILVGLKEIENNTHDPVTAALVRVAIAKAEKNT